MQAKYQLGTQSALDEVAFLQLTRVYYWSVHLDPPTFMVLTVAKSRFHLSYVWPQKSVPKVQFISYAAAGLLTRTKYEHNQMENFIIG